jgi:hypothetical protein
MAHTSSGQDPFSGRVFAEDAFLLHTGVSFDFSCGTLWGGSFFVSQEERHRYMALLLG